MIFHPYNCQYMANPGHDLRCEHRGKLYKFCIGKGHCHSSCLATVGCHGHLHGNQLIYNLYKVLCTLKYPHHNNNYTNISNTDNIMSFYCFCQPGTLYHKDVRLTGTIKP